MTLITQYKYNRVLRPFVSFLFILLSILTYAQNTATIHGKLTNKNGKPSEDISISIFGMALPPTYSNKLGYFEYQVPANEKIVLVFSHINYIQQQDTIILKPGERKEINRTLSSSNRALLQSIEVVDKQNRTLNNIRIDPNIISNLPTASGDFNSILFSLPGVSSRNELSSQYSVRGGNFDENLVYVNDIEIYRPFLIRSGQQEGLSFVNSDMVSSILFSAGGFEARYGDKMSSVLDIQYRKPRKFAGTASGSLLGSNIHLEGASPDYRFTWIMGTRYKTNQYILNTLDTRGDYSPSFTDFQTFLTYDLSDKWEVNILGNYAENKFQVVPQSRETSFGTINQAYRLKIYFDGQEVDEFSTAMAAVSIIQRPNSKLQLKYISSVFRTAESEAYDIMGQYFIDELETDFGKPNFGDTRSNLGIGTFINHARNNLNGLVYNAEHKGTYTYGNKTILWGAKYQGEQIDDQLSEWKYVDSAGFSLPQLPYNAIELQDVYKINHRLSSERLQSYIQHVWNKQSSDSSEISLTAGLRANYWTLNRQTVFSPRITMAYKPNWQRDILFRLSSGYYYQPPFYRELRDLFGIIHPNVKAQSSIHFVLSSDLNFTAWDRPFKFVSEIYYKHLDNLIPYEIDNVRLRYYAENNARGYATGIDMKINGEFINGVESWASLSLLQTKEDITNDFYYDYFNSDGEKIIPGFTFNSIATDSVKNEPGYIPRPTDQLVRFGLFFQDYLPRHPDFKMHLNLQFGTSLPFGPPSFERYKDTLKMPAYRRVDIGFSYQLVKENQPLPERNPFRYLKSAWISLEIYNLLQINNTVSYLWVKDINNRQYAIPNYLTGILPNLRIVAKF